MDDIVRVFLLTRTFPCSEKGEEFLHDELRCLPSNISMTVIPINYVGEIVIKRSIPDNVDVVGLFRTQRNGMEKAVNCIRFLTRAECWKEIALLIKTNRLDARNIYKLLAFGSSSIAILNRLNRIIEKEDNPSRIVYSYWMIDSAYAAAMSSAKNGIPAICRAHRGDLYEEKQEGYIPMREYIIRHMRKVFPISQHGKEYLINRYGFSDTFEKYYLGVNNATGMHEIKEQTPFRIVSCSNIIPVKRVPLIAKGISGLSGIRIEWVHFGEGNEQKAVDRVVKEFPENISVCFKGHMENSQIHEYYNTRDVHLFINASEDEGLPVSIMEAMSHGIPVVATDVGGTSEIVHDGCNGILLKKGFAVKELTSAIDLFIRMKKEQYEEYRKNAQNTWKSSFYAEKNYKQFYERIGRLSNE